MTIEDKWDTLNCEGIETTGPIPLPINQEPRTKHQEPRSAMPAPKYSPHYRLSDYQQWEGEWELWNGLAIAMIPSPFGKHQKAITRLAYRFMTALEAADCVDCEAVVELDWIIADDMVVRPDLSLCCGCSIERFIEASPTLIVEVLSDSTEHKDRTAKRDLYASEGVKYYLLVDVEREAIEVLELHEGSYELLTPISSSNYEFAFSPTCTVALDLGNFFKPRNA